MTKDKVKEQEMGARIAEIEKLQEIQVGGGNRYKRRRSRSHRRDSHP